MIALMVLMTVVIIALSTLLVLAFFRLEIVHRDVAFAMDEQHDLCVQQVTKRVGDLYAAQVLTLAAADYDAPDEAGTLNRLAREEYQPGGPSMPALWLRDRAARLIVPEDYEEETHV